MAEADCVVWLDNVRYTTPGWQDRNILPDGTQLTVPVKRDSHRDRLRQVLIDGTGWAADHASHIERVFDGQPHFDREIPHLIAGSDWSGERLVDLSTTLLDVLIPALGIKAKQVRQSEYMLGGGSVTERLIRTVTALGGDSYLAAPNSWSYLDAAEFEKAGIDLKYHSHEGSNPCCLTELYA